MALCVREDRVRPKWQKISWAPGRRDAVAYAWQPGRGGAAAVNPAGPHLRGRWRRINEGLNLAREVFGITFHYALNRNT
jgi:hypothetical protein